MPNKEEQIKQIITSGPLAKINFYQVNEVFFELSEDGYWLIDTGIELIFPSGTISAAWNSTLDCFELKNDIVKNMYTGDNLFQLETKNMNSLNRFIGLNVVETNFKTKGIEYIVDYTMRTEIEKQFVELILTFQNKEKIQIALVNFTLEENKAPTDFAYSINTSVLISTKKIIEINDLG